MSFYQFVCITGITSQQPEEHYMHLKVSHPYSPALDKFYDRRHFKFNSQEFPFKKSEHSEASSTSEQWTIKIWFFAGFASFFWSSGWMKKFQNKTRFSCFAGIKKKLTLSIFDFDFSLIIYGLEVFIFWICRCPLLFV